MAQTSSLLISLKKSLKAHGYTYADVAKHIGLTQASIKRLFSEENISLQRLDQICQMMDLEISDLVLLMNEQQSQLQQLSVEQEQELSQDLGLLLIALSVLNKWTMDEIIEHYELETHYCIQKLARLDKLKIIELLPGNRIKLLVAPNFGWRDNGPIQEFFQHTIGQEFFNSRFNQDEESLIVLNGMLASASNSEFQRKLKRIAQEFEVLNQEDSNLPLEQRFGVTVVLAMRSWRYGLSQHLLKKHPDQSLAK
ncbi:helix-turn-helix domain-containing protein [Thalassomonas sp. M1454]|uniref:helix-turn-helix domain-containing protein n=1 Tax=Thalassomonas sp. M1454 TaxID=2594477 RepID=UPI0011800041|nr:helix-turn-helix transcriptional regulator [Thalassomonas sp. M1454]TRX58116.1 helix-turn-helix transcriptional regulator [Thalassomonas sp. M1454]